MKKILLVFVICLLVVSAVYLVRLEQIAATTTTATSLTPMGGMDLWEGSWISEKTKKNGNFAVTLEKDGSNISGNIKIDGSRLTKGGEIKGTINGNQLEFGLVKDKRGELKYFGTILEDKMYGTWQIPVIKDRGTWEATRQGS